jgi:hypothetical protein
MRRGRAWQTCDALEITSSPAIAYPKGMTDEEA